MACTTTDADGFLAENVARNINIKSLIYIIHVVILYYIIRA